MLKPALVALLVLSASPSLVGSSTSLSPLLLVARADAPTIDRRAEGTVLHSDVLHSGVLHSGVVHIGPSIPPGVPWLREATLADLESAGGAGALALRPEQLLDLLESSPRRVLELPGDVILSGEWSWPADRLALKARGAIDLAGLRLLAPGAEIDLRGSALRLRHGARIDVSSPEGHGGTVVLATGSQGAIEIAASATIDASGTDGHGGAIRLDGHHVAAHGSLLALGRGRIDVLASGGLDFFAAADTGGGTIRLDPANMLIGAFGGINSGVVGATTISPNANTGMLDAGNLAGLLATNDVIVHTQFAAGMATGLDMALTGDATAGDLEVQAPVLWNSAFFLWLLAEDDLIVRAPVQNAGSGSVVGIAGWDGTTMAALDDPDLAGSVFGNATGDAFVVGTHITGAGMPPPVLAEGTSFGSRLGQTAFRGRNVRLAGSVTANGNDNGFAMVGYRIEIDDQDASGDIRVAAQESLRLIGGTNAGRYRFAQIGHGGQVDGDPTSPFAPQFDVNQGDLSGDIVASAGHDPGDVIEVFGGGNSAYGQIGHGGDIRFGNERPPAGSMVFTGLRGDLSGDITVTGWSLRIDTETGVGNFAMVGHGGRGGIGATVQGDIAGAITVMVDTTLALDSSGLNNLGFTMIGHGGLVNTNTQGNPTNRVAMLGTQTGDLTIEVGGDLSLLAGTGSGYTQIGHGGAIHFFGTADTASGAIDVTVGGNATLQGGNGASTICYAQVGHGGYVIGSFATGSVRQAVGGAVDLDVAGILQLLAGPGQAAYAQVGSGGLVWSQPNAGQMPATSFLGASGDVRVVAGILRLRGGSSNNVLSYAQIGNGGAILQIGPTSFATQGTVSGDIRVDTIDDLELLGGADNQGTNYSHIGHGGISFDTSGVLGTQGPVTGAVTLDVGAETNLVNGIGAAQWLIGHQSTGGFGMTSSPVTVSTDTLDFTTASASTNTTIDVPDFWERFAIDNVPGGQVTLRVRGPNGNDGDFINQEPIVDHRTPMPMDPPIPIAPANRLRVLASRNVSLEADLDNDGPAFLDFVADDAFPSPPLMGTSQMTVASGVSIDGDVRLFAVSPALFAFSPADYTPPAQAGGVWHDVAGMPVVGVNFKVALGTDLSVDKVAAASVVPGENLVYTITVGVGGIPADMVSLSDTLPAGTTFVSMPTPAGWSCMTPALGASGTVTCSIATLPVGNTVFTLTVATDPALIAGTIIDNTAMAATTTTDANPGNESDGAMTTVAAASADLSVTKTDAPDPVTPGASLVYSVTVMNSGPSNAANVELEDVLPAGTTFGSLPQPAGWTCTTPAVGSSGTVSCTIASLGLGSTNFTLTVAVDPSAVAGTMISNTSDVTASTVDPDPGEESATAMTTVGSASADVVLTKTEAPDPVPPGGNLVYTITITNNGPSTASTLALSDTLPADTTFVSMPTPAGWSCMTPAVGTGGLVSCTRASLPPGASVFTLTVAVDGALAGGSTIDNTADVTSATADPVPGDTSDSTSTTVGNASAEVSVTKTVTPDPVAAGANAVYTITLDNDGPDTAFDAFWNDALPASTTFVSLVAPAGWSCLTPAMGANGNVSCELGVFPVGAAVFTLTVMVDVAAGSGALANTVTAGAATPDPTPANSDIATTTVDGDGPTVLQVSSVADTGDGVLADGESTSVEITELLITFDEELQDPPGDGGSDDATNPANYLLIEAGTNGAIETAACGPAGGDDGTVAITGVTYDSGSSTATLVLGAPLAVGEYRLFACGSTSLLDLLGNPLQGGQDFALDFAIVVAASIIEVPTIGDVGRWLLIALLGLAGLAVLWRRGV